MKTKNMAKIFCFAVLAAIYFIGSELLLSTVRFRSVDMNILVHGLISLIPFLICALSFKLLQAKARFILIGCALPFILASLVFFYGYLDRTIGKADGRAYPGVLLPGDLDYVFVESIEKDSFTYVLYSEKERKSFTNVWCPHVILRKERKIGPGIRWIKSTNDICGETAKLEVESDRVKAVGIFKGKNFELRLPTE